MSKKPQFINNRKLTHEICDTENLIFGPLSSSDNYRIQKKLLQMGFIWNDKYNYPHFCEVSYVTICRGVIGYSIEARRDFALCTIDQLPEVCETRDRIFLRGEFNRLAAMMEQKDKALHARLDGLQQEIDDLKNGLPQERRLPKQTLNLDGEPLS